MPARACAEQGQALPIVLALVTLVFLVGTVLAAQASTALRTTRANTGEGGDFYAADGAAELGIWWQRNGNAGNPPVITLDGLAAAGTVSVAPPTPAGPGWKQWGYNGQSWSASGAPGPAAYGLRWGTPPTVTQGSPAATATVADDGYVYVGATDGLYAFKPDGTLAWSFLATSISPHLGSFIGSPALTTRGGQRLVVVGTDGNPGNASSFLGLLETPAHTAVSIAFSFTLGVGVNRGFVDGARLNSTGTVAFVGARNNNVYAFDLTGSGTIAPLWTATAGGPVIVSPSLNDSGTRLYAATSTGILNAYDVASGARVWNLTVAAGAALTAPAFARVGSSAHVYVGTAATQTIVAVADAGGSGSAAWSVGLGANALSTPAVWRSGSQTFVYAGDSSGDVVKLEDLGTSGATRWTYQPVVSGIQSGLALDTGGDIYFGNQAGSLYRIRDGGTSASTVWSGSPGLGAVQSGLVIGALGDLFAVTAGNRLLAVGAAIAGGTVTVTGAAGASTVTTTYSDVGAGTPALTTWRATR